MIWPGAGRWFSAVEVEPMVGLARMFAEWPRPWAGRGPCADLGSCPVRVGAWLRIAIAHASGAWQVAFGRISGRRAKLQAGFSFLIIYG